MPPRPLPLSFVLGVAVRLVPRLIAIGAVGAVGAASLSISTSALAPMPSAAVGGGHGVVSGQETVRDSRNPDRGLSEELRTRLALVDPGRDAVEVERWAALLEIRLARLAERWENGRFDGLGESEGFAPAMPVAPLFDAAEPGSDAKAWRVHRRSPQAAGSGETTTLARALAAWRAKFPVGARLELETLEIVGLPPRLEARVRAQASGAAQGVRRQDNAEWSLAFELGERGATVTGLTVIEFESVELAHSSPGPFVDVSAESFADPALWRERFAPGLDRWRRVLAANLFPGALGHHGLAVGDVDGDGREDLYLCRPGGLPNQLLLHAAPGRFVDASSGSGVDLLDYSSSALLADFDGDADLDLVVATGSGLVFFENRAGAGPERPRFERRLWIERSLATSIAAADVDGDGDLDLFACSYLSPYEKDGLPVPYHDAENGEANQLLCNEGDWSFVDVTVESGLDENNRRFSLAASFEDFDDDGDPDLYVANDFGRNNLYRNDGWRAREGGRFRDVAQELGAEDIAAGMGVTWGDFDRDGWVDLYVTNMHSPAGSRITSRTEFRGNAAAASMGAYRRHARGNTLLRNVEGRRFEDVSLVRGAEFGRWGWGAIFVDFDNDGALDLFAPNGFVSGEGHADIDGFFWRQAVLQSPEDPGEAGSNYATGWSASNRLMRQGWSWNGFERNVALWNTGDGRFVDASAALGLDHADDTRAAARMDFDHDGDLDLVLTARTGPMLRLVENRAELGRGWIELEPRSDDPARTAVGARVVVETTDGRKLVETLRCGEGYLAQSSWRLHFGLGAADVRAVSVRWPGGTVESFGAPARGAIHVLRRGSGKALALSPSVAPEVPARGVAESGAGSARRGARCVLPTPIGIPRLALETVDGKAASVLGITQLGPQGTGEPLLLIAFSALDPGSLAELARVGADAEALRGAGLRQVLALCVDPPAAGPRIAGQPPSGRERAIAELARIGWPFARGFASEESVQILELVQAALHDDAHALTLPTAFLVSADGKLAATHEGLLDPARLREDLGLFALDAEALRRAATPFPGTWIADESPRPDADIAARLSAHGLERAASEYELVRSEVRGFDAASFQVDIGVARQRQGRLGEAIVHYRRALAADPGHVLATQCLAVALHQQGDLKGALAAYQDAIRLDPSHAQTRCNLGYLCIAMNDLEGARAQVQALDALKSPLARTLESFLAKKQ